MFTEKELLRMVRAKFREVGLPSSGRFSKHVRTWAAVTSLYDFNTPEMVKDEVTGIAADEFIKHCEADHKAYLRQRWGEK